MTADEWLEECLLIEGGKEVKRKDVINLGVYRTQFLRDVFNEIQRTVKVEVPRIGKDEHVKAYRSRVIKAARLSGATVVIK